MGSVMFYHLTRSAPEDTLRQLIGRAMGQGWRVMVRGTDEGALDRLDAALWLGPEDGFLPHGRAGGPHDARQPVLIGTGAVTNGAQGLMLVDGALTTPDEVRGLERVWIVFDGNDADRVAAARAAWTALTGAGIAAQYWSEESGRWEKKAERPASG